MLVLFDRKELQSTISLATVGLFTFDLILHYPSHNNEDNYNYSCKLNKTRGTTLLTIHRQTLLITRSVADAAQTLLETDLSHQQRTQSQQLGTGPAQSLRISPSLVIYSPKVPGITLPPSRARHRNINV